MPTTIPYPNHQSTDLLLRMSLITTLKNTFFQFLYYLIPQLCPFSAIETINWGSVEELRKIQLHIQQGNCFHLHPPLNQITLAYGYGTIISTPLLKACEKNNLDAVKMVVEEWGVDVNESAAYHYKKLPDPGKIPSFCLKESPPLVVAFARRYMDIAKYLIDKGAGSQVRDDIGLSFLHYAALDIYPFGKPDVLRSLLFSDHVTVSDKIEALELAGARILLLRQGDEATIRQAFAYWNEAMDLRNHHSESIPAKVLRSDNNIVDWRAVEWTSKNDLRELQRSPSKYQMQAILVAQRILSGISYAVFLKHLWPVVEGYLSQLRWVHRHSELLEICWIMLEAVPKNNLRDYKLGQMIMFVRDFLVSTLDELNEKRNAILTPETLRMSIELATDYSSHLLMNEVEVDSSYLFTMIQLVALIASLPTEMISHEILCCLHRLVKRDERDEEGDNLLLGTCSMLTLTTEKLASVRLLLKVGADPNSTNKITGSNALHILAYMRGKGWRNCLPEPAELLIEAGIHIDQVDAEGRTPLDEWKRGNVDRGIPVMTLPPSGWTNRTVPRLLCLSARSLRNNKIPYKQQNLPKALCDFVDMH